MEKYLQSPLLSPKDMLFLLDTATSLTYSSGDFLVQLEEGGHLHIKIILPETLDSKWRIWPKQWEINRSDCPLSRLWLMNDDDWIRTYYIYKLKTILAVMNVRYTLCITTVWSLGTTNNGCITLAMLTQCHTMPPCWISPHRFCKINPKSKCQCWWLLNITWTHNV